MLFLSSNLRWC